MSEHATSNGDAATDGPAESADDVFDTNVVGADPSGPGDDTVVLDPDAEPLSVEGLLDDLDRVTAERDAYLDDMRRVAADFANFRRQTEKRNVDLVEQANARLVEHLLPTLDACEAALRHGAKDIEPVQVALLGVLEREGLLRLAPEGQAFDPASHEAVLHEPADDDAADGPIVTEVLRTGYSLNGRIVRPALVKVKG
jgi:molecular chaperone GrpE